MSVRETRNRGLAIGLCGDPGRSKLRTHYNLAFCRRSFVRGYSGARVGPASPDGEIATDQGWAGANQYIFSSGLPSQPDAVVQMVRDAAKLYCPSMSTTIRSSTIKTRSFLSSSGTSDSTRIHIYPVSNSGNGTNSAPREIRVWRTLFGI